MIINSAVLAGWRKIAPLISFLSITSGVLFVSSITTLNANNPCLCWTDSKYGLTIFKNLVLVCKVFCSNTKNLEALAINFLSAINNLLTLILSNAVALSCNVFWPQIQTPVAGNVAIGLILESYNTSLSAWFNLILASITFPNIPLFKPAGANHSAAILSEAAIAPGTITDGGTNTGKFRESSNTFAHG